VSRREYDEYEDEPRRPRRLTGLDGMFANTNIVALILFGFCCGFIALVLGIVGLATCKDERARQNALIVTLIGGAMTVVGVVLQFTGMLAQMTAGK
jgi:hypothetical protein